MNDRSAVIGLSGGADSTAAASLLLEGGFDLVGVYGIFMDLQISKDHLDRAREVAEALDIKLIERDLRNEFRREVIDYFTGEYRNGRTPSPCIVCNRRIKFPLLDRVREEMGFQFISTGHYARISSDGNPLMRGVEGRDQSYFLARVPGDILKRTLLPLAECDRDGVDSINESVFGDRDWNSSSDICFINRDYSELVKEKFPETGESGLIVNTAGKRIGTHSGIADYTYCQRKGIQTSLNIPLYVKDIVREENKIVVGTKEECMKAELAADNPKWFIPPDNGSIYNVQTYSVQSPFEARLILNDNTFTLNFLEPQFHVTPGQLAVVYNNNAVVGSGWIR